MLQIVKHSSDMEIRYVTQKNGRTEQVWLSTTVKSVRVVFVANLAAVAMWVLQRFEGRSTERYLASHV
jgi:hypothetical protein